MATKTKEQESPITKKDYSRLAFEMLGGGLAGGLIAYSFDVGIVSSATLVSGSVAALRVTINLLADLDPLLARLERVASSSRSKKGEVGAIFAPAQEETPKKGDIRLMPINGVDYEFPESGGLFPFALPRRPSLKPVSRSSTKKKRNVIMIEGDCASPDSGYRYGQTPVTLLYKMLRRVDLGQAKGKLDKGQYLSFHSNVEKRDTRWLASDDHWLLINTINAASLATGIQLIRTPGTQKWSRLKYSGRYTYKFITSWLEPREGVKDIVWVAPPSPDDLLRCLERGFSN